MSGDKQHPRFLDDIPRQFRRVIGVLLQVHAQFEPEGAANAGLANQSHAATHQFHETPCNRGSEPGTAHGIGCGLIRLNEFFKDLFLHFFRNADAGIDDLEPQIDMLAGDVQDRDIDNYPAFFGELDGVADEVDQYLADQLFVTDQLIRRIRGDVMNECKTFSFSQRRQHAHYGFKHDIEIERLILDVCLARLYFGDVEDILDQVQGGFRGGHDVGEESFLLRIEVG